MIGKAVCAQLSLLLSLQRLGRTPLQSLYSSSPMLNSTPRLHASRFFNLSLHRSATTSTAKAFHDAHHRCFDWTGWDFERNYDSLFVNGKQGELLDVLLNTFPECSYYGDLPIPLLHQQLIERMPNASFFIVLRDVDEWAMSSFEHCMFVGNHPNNPVDNILPPSHRMMLDVYGLLDTARSHLSGEINRESLLRIWRRLYHQHLIAVVSVCNANSIPLKMFYLSDPNISAQMISYANPDCELAASPLYRLAHLHANDRGRNNPSKPMVT